MSINRRYTIKYAVVQGFYWTVFCAVMGYITVFLLDKGYSNSLIGIVLALSNVAAAILQPLIAALADRYEKISLRVIIQTGSGIIILAAMGIVFCQKASVLLTACMLLVSISTIALQPFVNTLSVRLEEQGHEINFGACRACGSISYAFVSAIMGILVKYYSMLVVPFAMILLAVGLFVSTRILAAGGQRQGACSEKKSGKTAERKEAQGLGEFFANNKRFFVFLAGIVFVFYFHMLSCNYLIQIVENVGGDSANMGIASSIAAVAELPAMIFFLVLVKRIECRKLIWISGIVFTIKSILFLTAGSIGMIYLAHLLQGGSYALFIPASVYYVGHLLEQENMVKGQSLVTTAITLGGVLASIAGGWLIDTYGVQMMLLTGTIMAAVGTIMMGMAAEKR